MGQRVCARRLRTGICCGAVADQGGEPPPAVGHLNRCFGPMVANDGPLSPWLLVAITGDVDDVAAATQV